MAVIADVLGMIDTTVATVVSDTYAGISTAVAPVVAVGSVLLVILVGLNIATQTIPLNLRTAVGLIRSLFDDGVPGHARHPRAFVTFEQGHAVFIGMS